MEEEAFSLSTEELLGARGFRVGKGLSQKEGGKELRHRGKQPGGQSRRSKGSPFKPPVNLPHWSQRKSW